MRCPLYPPTKQELEERERTAKAVDEAQKRMVAAGEEELRKALHPTVLERLNPKNWSDKTKGKLKGVACAALGAALMKLGLSLGVAAEIAKLIFGG